MPFYYATMPFNSNTTQPLCCPEAAMSPILVFSSVPHVRCLHVENELTQ